MTGRHSELFAQLLLKMAAEKQLGPGSWPERLEWDSRFLRGS